MYKGGYYKIREPLIKTGIFRHSADIGRAIPNAQLEALNRVSETPWSLNQEVCAVAEDATKSNSVIAALPPMDDEALPPMVSEESWESMSSEEKANIKSEREAVHSRNAKATGQRESLLRKLSLMRDLKSRTFWFPHAVDWRGRAYAMPQDLNPQSDDFARGVLTFATGRPLGQHGMYHLALRGAASFGMDKVLFDQRVQWFSDNEKLVIDSATNPLDGERWWCEADEPWQFLATCMAWVGYLNEGENYVCNLPIPYDATCSGLQHLSGMGLSEDGGRRVNLTDDPCRHDIYEVVAEKVVELLRRDVKAGVVEASNWSGHVHRKTVKRQTMTICYGATRMGMRQMAIKDGHTKGLDGVQSKNAAYLTNVILEAIENVLTEAKLIMDWLQDCASMIAEANQPIVFTTPIGMVVQQAYYKRAKRRVSTLLGEAILWEEDSDLGMDRGRMRQGIVPNVIHAYDAAHLYMTVNSTASRMSEEMSWAMVHDSFATWAGDYSRIMNDVLREEFVRIYREDQLGILYESFQQTGVDVPLPPTRGDLDIQQVLRSQYFFS